jgi:hypothetical protein
MNYTFNVKEKRNLRLRECKITQAPSSNSITMPRMHARRAFNDPPGCAPERQAASQEMLDQYRYSEDEAEIGSS